MLVLCICMKIELTSGGKKLTVKGRHKGTRWSVMMVQEIYESSTYEHRKLGSRRQQTTTRNRWQSEKFSALTCETSLPKAYFEGETKNTTKQMRTRWVILCALIFCFWTKQRLWILPWLLPCHSDINYCGHWIILHQDNQLL